jgi:hypothetical protein
MQTPIVNTQKLTGSEFGDSYVELTTVTLDLDPGYSFSYLKSAVSHLNEFVAWEVKIPRPCSDYDCTGHAFTSNITRIHKMLCYNTLVFVYEHWISIDC